MIDTHDTTRFVKERIVETAVKLLHSASCEVSAEYAGDYVTIKAYLPPDSADPHGDRMKAALEAVKATD